MYKKFLKSLRVLAVALFMMVSASALSSEASAVVLESSGDGMSFYDHILAPSFPAEVSDSNSYALMSYSILDGYDPFYHVLISLICSSEPLVFSDGELTSADGGSFSYQIFFYTPSELISSAGGFLPGVWNFADSDSIVAALSTTNVVWSDYTVLDSIGDVVSSATIPFPLDGYNVIRWDGVREGYADSTVSFPVASYLDVPESVYVVENIYSRNGNELDYYSYGSVTTDLTVSGNSWISYNSDNYRTVFSDYDNDVLGFRSGISFVGIGTFTQYLGYKPQASSPVGPDFTETELIIASSDYDFQSADIEVGWSHLPSIPYPDHYQYYITARLNDGSLPTHPYTYIGSSDDPPSGDLPVWFRFEDLQPETAYSVTFELRYTIGSNVSFSDSVSSGVTTTVSFTTLSDGSISDGDKAIIGAIQDANRDHEQWLDSEMGSAVGDLGEDTAATDKVIDDLNEQEEALQDDAYARFQEVSSMFTGFDGTVGAGIGLAGTLFSRFFNVLGPYKIIYTFPLLLGLAMVIIGRLNRSSFRLEDKDHDQFIIDGW